MRCFSLACVDRSILMMIITLRDSRSVRAGRLRSSMAPMQSSRPLWARIPNFCRSVCAGSGRHGGRIAARCSRTVRYGFGSLGTSASRARNMIIILTDCNHTRCVYAVYITSFFNFALFNDLGLAYLLWDSPYGSRQNLYLLAAWILATKMVKLFPYFLRHPEDLRMLLGYFVFAYFHSFVKLYALLTFWNCHWGGRDLKSLNEAAEVRESEGSGSRSRSRGSGAEYGGNAGARRRARSSRPGSRVRSEN